GHARGTKNDGIADDLASELDVPAHDVVETNGTLGNVQSNRALLSGGETASRFVVTEIAAGSRIDGLASFFERLLALLFELLLRAETVVGLAFVHELERVRAIDLPLVALAIRRVRAADVRTLVPLDAEPLEVFEELRLVTGFAAIEVGVFDAKDERTFLLTREEPIEKSSAGIADMNLAGRRRSETYAYGHVSILDDRRWTIDVRSQLNP